MIHLIVHSEIEELKLEKRSKNANQKTFRSKGLQESKDKIGPTSMKASCRNNAGRSVWLMVL
jgi:hypothetical protein